MNGQWIGSYSGTNTGFVVADLDEISGLLRLFLDEVGNNGKDDACEDGTNDYQNDSQYREASHSIDPRPHHRGRLHGTLPGVATEGPTWPLQKATNSPASGR